MNIENRLKILFEYAPDAYYLFDLKANFVSGNKAAEKLTGYRKEELTGKSFLNSKLLSADQMLKASGVFAKNLHQESTGPDDFLLNKKDGSQFLYPVAKIVLQHHEMFNCSGYPKGLTGKEILQETRIIAVADVVEAMSSHRPYRPALGIDAALEEIQKNRGILYDPKVVDACLKLFSEKKYKLE